jgi:plasmid stabilization system protein ParE
MAVDIRFERKADEDLEEIVEFLGVTSTAARRFAERFDRGIAQLLLFPESAPNDGTGVRVLYLTRTSYAIVYEFNESQLTILSVAHASRPRTEPTSRP